MLYDHPISLLHVKQPHDGFLTALITGVPSRMDQPYCVGLQNLAPQQFIARGRDCQTRETSQFFRSLRNRVERHDWLVVVP